MVRVKGKGIGSFANPLHLSASGCCQSVSVGSGVAKVEVSEAFVCKRIMQILVYGDLSEVKEGHIVGIHVHIYSDMIW